MDRARSPRSFRRAVPAGAGSAYILTLMVLVVLTVAGLTLALITQSERQLGINERVVQRVFYAADAGTAASIARVLSQNNHDGMTFLAGPPKETSGSKLAERVQTSRFHPILSWPCNFCEINQGAQFYDVNHAVTSLAERVGWSNGDAMPPDDAATFSRKTVGEMVSLQPWQVSLNENVLPSLEEDELEKIKF